MAKGALTARSIETMQPGATRREIPDALVPGLYLIVQSSGAKSWAVRYRIGNRTRKATLGGYPALGLADARNSARAALRAAAEGRDPGTAKVEARRAAAPDTIAAASAEFIRRHCQRHNRTSTIQAVERMFRTYILPAWGNRPVKSISRRDIIALVDGLAGTKPVQANRLTAVLSKFFGWAVTQDIIATSPCIGVTKPSAEKPRDRILSDAEIHAVWTAAETLGGTFGALVRLLILTGQRRDEVAGITWDEIDLETRTWTLPASRTKNKRQHDIPITDALLAIINAQPRIKGCPYILTNDDKTPASNYGKNKAALDALLPPDMPHWVLHDLRRTCASGMARLGVLLPTIEKVLNHVSGSFGGIVAVYQRHDFAGEKREALDAWGRHVLGLADGAARECGGSN